MKPKDDPLGPNTERSGHLRPVWAEVDLAAVRHNVQTLRAYVAPSELLAVVKADGYGHGAEPVARAALHAGASMLGVALVEEGVALRKAGISAPVLVLSEPIPDAANTVLEYDLTPAVYTTAGVEALAKAAAASGVSGFPVHLKVDTGMHRVGCAPTDTAALAASITRYPSLSLASVWTHFAVADEPNNPYSQYQLDVFDALVCELANGGSAPQRLHCANTAAAIAIPASRKDLVRVGIGLYGIAPSLALHDLVDLRPALSVKARVGFVKRVAAHERVSYGLRYTLARDANIVTLPIGYADGVPRSLAAHGGEVLIRGRRYLIAGTITMDQTMVDVGDLEVAPGEEVVLLGTQGGETIPAQEWADRVGTIAYEIVCGIGPRVPRHYLNGVTA